MTAVLEIRLFGGVAIRRGDAPISGFVSSKAPALLAYLAVTGRTHQRDTLAALLWGEMTDADAKNNLRQTLTNLRKLVDPHLIITRETVGWNTAVPHTLDVAQFENQLHTARGADLLTRIAALQQAIVLYQGDFLAGFYVRDAPEFEEWMLAQRARYRELTLHTLHSLAEYHLSRGEYGQAIDNVTRLLSLEPWREEAHRQLMLALAHSGQRTAALAQYETCRRLLDAELGVSPSAETTDLYQRLRAADHSPRHNLPPQPTPFIGRADELAHLESLLQRPETRLVTLVGAGGMGKTRLALQTAERIHRRGLFLHGVYYVPLEGVDSPLLLATAVAQAIAFPFSGSREPADQLLAQVQNQELLLVLDNFEHLLAETGWLVRLLQHAPGVKLLLTSREPLNLQWEWALPVEGLTVPAADETAADCAAVQLFASRARARQPLFALTPETLPSVIRICQLVGGMPLALELAAAASRHYTCAEIATAIAQNLDFLTSTYRDTPPRQRSLRATFDYAWGQLAPSEREVMAALSVFTGSFSQAAAQQVMAAAPALLAALVDKSLLGRMDNGRYHLHHTLRQYAAEQLSTVRQETLRRQHAAYFADWLRQQESRLFTSAQTDIFQHLIADHDNIRAAWQVALAELQLDWLTQGLTTLRTFYNIQSRFQEGAEWLADTAVILESHASQTAAPQHPVHQLLGKVLTRRASFCAWLGRRAEAEALFQQALTLTRRFSDPAEMGFLLLNMGYLTVVTGNYEAAGQQFQESLDSYRRAADERGMADALSAQGALHNMTGDWEKARQYLEDSVAISRRLQDEDRLRSSLTNLGNVHYLTGNHTQARRYYEEVLPLCQKVGDRMSEAIVVSNLGTLAQEASDYKTAEQQLLHGLQLFQEAQHQPAVIQCSTNLAAVYRAMGQFNRAQQTLQDALTQAVSQQYDSLIPLVVFEIGLFYQAVGQQTWALPLLLWMSQHPAAQAENRLKAEALLAEAWTRLAPEEITAVQQSSQAITPEAILTNLTTFTMRSA